MSSARKPLSLEKIKNLKAYTSLDEQAQSDITKIYEDLNKVQIDSVAGNAARAKTSPQIVIAATKQGFASRVKVTDKEIKDGILGTIDHLFDSILVKANTIKNKAASTAAATTAAAAATPPVSTAATPNTSSGHIGLITDHVNAMAKSVIAQLKDQEILLRDISVFAAEYLDLINNCKESKSSPDKLRLTKELAANLEAQNTIINNKTTKPEAKTEAAIQFYNLLNKAADQKSFKTGLFSDGYKTLNKEAFYNARKNKTLSIRNVIAKYMTQGDYLKLRDLVNKVKQIQAAIDIHKTPKPK
jgi:hypothetical protein